MRSLAVGTALAALLIATACEDEAEPSRCEPTEIQFSGLDGGTELRVPRIAAGARLAVWASPTAGELREVRSSDEGVAFPTLSGHAVLVEARTPGTARIDVGGDCGATAAFAVEVAAIGRADLRPVVDEVGEAGELHLPDGQDEIPGTLCPAGASLLPGATLLLRTRPLDAEGRLLEGALVPRWESSDPGVTVVPFGRGDEGLASVSWYQGHPPVTVTALGGSFDLAFSDGESAASLQAVHVLDQAAIDRLELESDYEFVAVLPYDAAGRLLLGPNPTLPSASSRDETVARVSSPAILGRSGLAAFTVFARGAGTTTVDFSVRDATAHLEVVVLPEERAP